MDALPNLLLLEDDPPSQLFLGEALRALPARVDTAGSLAQARAAIATGDHALWLFDARLPDGDSAQLLGELRAAQRTTPALALTADRQPSRQRTLLAAGFVEVILKPLPAATLRAIARAHLPKPALAITDAERWNEGHALAAAAGVERTRDALRALFVAELPGLHARIVAALQGDDLASTGELLHRLKGSCAFVGADALLHAVQALAHAPHDPATRTRFSAECARLLG